MNNDKLKDSPSGLFDMLIEQVFCHYQEGEQNILNDANKRRNST